jgi:hypothetical protein
MNTNTVSYNQDSLNFHILLDLKILFLYSLRFECYDYKAGTFLYTENIIQNILRKKAFFL